MKQMVRDIAESLVDQPEYITVEESRDHGVVDLQLRVHPSDMGKVIGKQGRIANSIRQILKACAIKEDVKVNLEIRSIDE